MELGKPYNCRKPNFWRTQAIILVGSIYAQLNFGGPFFNFSLWTPKLCKFSSVGVKPRMVHFCVFLLFSYGIWSKNHSRYNIFVLNECWCYNCDISGRCVLCGQSSSAGVVGQLGACVDRLAAASQVTLCSTMAERGSCRFMLRRHKSHRQRILTFSPFQLNFIKSSHV